MVFMSGGAKAEAMKPNAYHKVESRIDVLENVQAVKELKENDDDDASSYVGERGAEQAQRLDFEVVGMDQKDRLVQSRAAALKDRLEQSIAAVLTPTGTTRNTSSEFS